MLHLVAEGRQIKFIVLLEFIPLSIGVFLYCKIKRTIMNVQLKPDNNPVKLHSLGCLVLLDFLTNSRHILRLIFSTKYVAALLSLQAKRCVCVYIKEPQTFFRKYINRRLHAFFANFYILVCQSCTNKFRPCITTNFCTRNVNICIFQFLVSERDLFKLRLFYSTQHLLIGTKQFYVVLDCFLLVFSVMKDRVPYV